MPLPPPNFVWGDLSGRDFCDKVNKAYDEVVQWRRNLFLVPFGKVGKALVQEMANLFQAYGENSSLECIALKSCLLMQVPLLQPEAVSWAFSKMMFLGNVHGALNFLSRNTSGLPLKLEDVIQTKEGTTESVLNIQESLHPEGKPLVTEALLSCTLPNALPADPVIFEAIDGNMIKSTTLHCKGSVGPSGVDARAWRRMCSSFKETSARLCEAIAGVAKCICTQPVSPSGLNALLACRLVPLNKNPGVRPIGDGEVAKHIVCKAVIRVVRKDIMLAVGPLQVCSGIGTGCEAAVHATREVFDESEVEGALLVDATDAFHALNRKVALQNIKYVCPALKTVLTNCYQSPIRLLVSGEGEILSKEGKTQGDPLGMAMFALAIVLLILKLMEVCQMVYQVWFADDATAAASCEQLQQW